MSNEPDATEADVFTQYGYCMYMAAALEGGLANAALQLEFLSEMKKNFESGKKPDKAKVDKDFDAFIDKQHGLTMGQILKKIKGRDELSAETKKRIEDALAKRNYLAHHFWRERAEDFEIKNKYAELAEELKENCELFESITKELHDALRTDREKLGITDERIEERINQEIQKLKDGAQEASQGPSVKPL